MLLEERSEILRRLRVSEGHLSIIVSMVETNQPYEQVLHLHQAARSDPDAVSAQPLPILSRIYGDI
ncbi:MAG: metal-sensing transcriptional repressor [Chloroflexi bacterium]|nr:metal-sensing transcriptional repressor [Chloroflexota bacterium]